MPRSLSPSDIADFRERLCDVATQLLVELGRDGFNMRELAARMGVSAMTTYRYFKDKDDILSAMRERAFGRLAERMETAAQANAAPDEKLAASIRAYVEFARHDSEHYVLMFELAVPRSQTVSAVTPEELRAHAALSEPLHQMAADGLFDGDPDTTAKVLWATLHGIAALYLTCRIADADFGRIVGETMRTILSTRTSAFTFEVDTQPVLTAAFDHPATTVAAE